MIKNATIYEHVRPNHKMLLQAFINLENEIEWSSVFKL